jgi:uncharacterized protein (TIGR03663 family)
MNNKHIFRQRLTIEASLWGVVVATALALRLSHLGLAPLTAREAHEATLAWRAASGQGFPTGDYSPLLLAANSLLFTLFSSGDVLARLIPALFGALLACTPLLLRRHVGRVGALASGLHLAVSPTALAASRQLAGTAVAATGVMVCVGCLACFIETHSRNWLTFAAVGLALAVSSGATAYALLLPLGAAWVFLTRLRLEGESSRLGQRVLCLKSHGPRFLLTLTLAVLGFSTGLGWNLSGIGGAGAVFMDWFGRFRPTPTPAASPLTLLVVYEFFGLAFGIGGLIWGLRRGHRFAALLGLWGGLEVLLLALMPGRMPTDLLWTVLPLTLLTGLIVEALVRDWHPANGKLRASYAGLVLVLWAYGYLMLGRYAALGDRPDLALAVIAVVAQALLGLSFGLALGPGVALSTAAATTGLALVALTVSTASGVAYGHPTDAREPLLREPTAYAVRDLVQTLRDLSWQQSGMPTTLEFAFQAPEDSVLAWYLRDFERAHRVDRLEDTYASEAVPILVTTRHEEAAPPPIGGEYVGQNFVLQTHWSPRALGCRFWEPGCNVAFDWLLFREAVPVPEARHWATLWHRVEVATSN